MKKQTMRRRRSEFGAALVDYCIVLAVVAMSSAALNQQSSVLLGKSFVPLQYALGGGSDEVSAPEGGGGGGGSRGPGPGRGGSGGGVGNGGSGGPGGTGGSPNGGAGGSGGGNPGGGGGGSVGPG